MNFFKRKKNKLPFGKPLVDNREIISVANVLKSGIYAHGPILSKFENEFANLPNLHLLQQCHRVLQGCIYFTFLWV